MSRRVVVTGLGHISPVGNTVEAGWQSLLAGKTGIANITKFDATDFSTRFAGEVKDFDIARFLPVKDARSMDTFIHYGLAAAIQALEDSGLVAARSYDERGTVAHGALVGGLDPERVGVIIGSGIGGLPRIEETHATLTDKGPRRINPFFVPASIINMVAGHLSILYGIKGPNLAIVTACTSGTHSIGEAARMIRHGEAEVMVAGGAEATVSPLGIGGFAAARALSTRNDDPATASRPWDKGRDGFVLGEGAGVLVLEDYEHAKQRGATIYCEIVGYGRTADAYHMTSPSEDGEGARRCMQAALKDAGLTPDAIQYINAHGTSTPQGDVAESEAVKGALGSAAQKVVVSSTKSMTGHLLGAAGGIEAVYTALAVKHGKIPPTINLHDQDPACDLDYCANTARDVAIDAAISNSFGFGGTNGSLVFKRV
ncbi:3-oxoacyl-[acyl-carrier-protein] synthase II [Chitinasiproducens palmae]|uniref:3-oxoacyl-[acyl-carrier-protein] synthase 2 n=1 Tax=Chitinasiproducens palmae TaxID=1770053 RepID=A0A1H2PUR9_9BURK|nr:3-oxoacyl-[acyl-carrier-protein] synthase II [Chitinasiproducens palmae]